MYFSGSSNGKYSGLIDIFGRCGLSLIREMSKMISLVRSYFLAMIFVKFPDLSELVE